VPPGLSQRETSLSKILLGLGINLNPNIKIPFDTDLGGSKRASQADFQLLQDIFGNRG
jgi:hypothetical protein